MKDKKKLFLLFPSMAPPLTGSRSNYFPTRSTPMCIVFWRSPRQLLIWTMRNCKERLRSNRAAEWNTTGRFSTYKHGSCAFEVQACVFCNLLSDLVDHGELGKTRQLPYSLRNCFVDYLKPIFASEKRRNRVIGLFF